MEQNQKCTNCNERTANHEIHKHWETPKDIYLCCKCYVEQGGTPSDWHSICMSTYEEIKKKVLNPQEITNQ